MIYKILVKYINNFLVIINVFGVLILRYNNSIIAISSGCSHGNNNYKNNNFLKIKIVKKLFNNNSCMD